MAARRSGHASNPNTRCPRPATHRMLMLLSRSLFCRGVFLQPLGAPEGQGYTLPLGGGSFGGSFGGSLGSFGGGGRRHHRGMSSG